MQVSFHNNAILPPLAYDSEPQTPVFTTILLIKRTLTLLMSRKKPSHKTQANIPTTANNQLRLIAGRWRGRKLPFPNVEGLRPTPDRVRETLFNWLAAYIVDALCLDPFTGSGALGLEALSRGAAHADMIDSSAIALQQLRSNMALLGTDSSQAIHANALEWLKQAPLKHYDIVFLDPPFHTGLAADCIKILAERAILKDQAWIYLEMATDEPMPLLPTHWQLHREKQAGQVRYQLYRQFL